MIAASTAGEGDVDDQAIYIESVTREWRMAMGDRWAAGGEGRWPALS